MQEIRDFVIDHQLMNDLNYDSLEDVAMDMIYLSAKSKLSEYQQEIDYYQNKYKKTFEEFKKDNSKLIEEEFFEEEDDLMAWQFAEENAQYWQKKIKDLESCW